MWIIVYLLFGAAFVLLLISLVRNLQPREAAKPARRPAKPRVARSATQKTLQALAWDAPIVAPPVLEGDALARRMRDRYIAARFPGVATGSAELADSGRVIRSARLYFEEDAGGLALELLTMAIQQAPASEPLRLAQLEIAFLGNARGRYVALAREFRDRLPGSPSWPEIARLGRALSPEEALFASGPGSRPHDHYGPWPDLPNWIQASWDLTSEVRAADFRREILRESGPEPARLAASIGA